jgi:hypothetical protein
MEFLQVEVAVAVRVTETEDFGKLIIPRHGTRGDSLAASASPRHVKTAAGVRIPENLHRVYVEGNGEE